MHQDLCYYETPPGFQFLHCLIANESGGENGFVDTFKVAEQLKKSDPESFEVLSKIPTTYHKLGVDHQMLFRHPIISVNAEGDVVAFNYSPPFEGPLSVPFKWVDPYYNALRTLTKIIRSSSMQMKLKMKPGDMISFNNRRILHGRTAFDPEKGERHIRGTYIDLDEFKSRYFTLERHFGNKSD